MADQTIGLDSATGLFGFTSLVTDKHEAMTHVDLITTLDAGNKFTEIAMHGYQTGFEWEVGIIDITDGVNNAPLIASVNLVSAGSNVRVSESITPVGTTGRTYAIVFRGVTSGAKALRTYKANPATDKSSLDYGSALASTFTDSANGDQQYAFSALATAASSLTAPSTTKTGDTLAFSFTGLDGPVAGATLTDANNNVVNLTNVTDNLDGTGTATVPAFDTDGQAACLYGDVTLAVTSVAGEGSVAPNSNAVLSGGTVVRGLYDFSDNAAPTDADYLSGANSPSTLDYSLGFSRGVTSSLSDGDGNVPYPRVFLPENTQEIYIEFDARFPDGVVHGQKFMKIFGKTDAVGNANITAGPNYSAAQVFDRISYGDGSTTGNDTQNQIRLDGTTSASDIGRSSGTAVINTPQGKGFEPADWGTGWHHFKYFFRFNTGTSVETEVADGAFYLEIDGVLYCDAGGLLNRHYQNSQYMNSAALYGYMQGQLQDITLDYDNIVILSGGFV